MPDGSLSLTVDTNVLWNLIEPDRPGHQDASRLFALHEAGQVSIAVTTRTDFDVPDGHIRRLLDGLEVMARPIGTAARIGFSRIGMGDMIVDEEYQEQEQALMNLLFPNSDPQSPKHKNRLADIDHLLGHHLNSRDIFITNEKGILARRKQLKDKFGIQVMSPAQFLESCEI